MEDDEIIRKLAALINEAVPLARAVLSNLYSDADRERLRALCGDRGVSDLSNYISGLCSQATRQVALETLEREERTARLKVKSAHT